MIENLPEGLRSFDDAQATRKNIYNYSKEAFQSKFPLEDDMYRIDVTDLEYDEDEEKDLEKQKKSLLTYHNLGTPLSGNITLTDKRTGDVLDTRRDVIARVPYYSPRGTIINNGSEYSIVNQSRLRPGTYTRKKQSGESEIQFNVKQGTGRGFRMVMDPDTGIFRVNIAQSQTPAYPFLKSMGVTDQEMVDSWGKEIWETNSKGSHTGALKRLYKRFAGRKAEDTATESDMGLWLRENLSKYEMDPSIVKSTLGISDNKGIDNKLLLRATQKVLNVTRGDEEPDDRDSPRYKMFLGPEDLFKERIERDSGQLARSLLYKVRRTKNLKPFYRGLFTGYYDSVLQGSGLALPLEESNPLHYLEQMNRVTAMGEGGIGSESAVTDEARDIAPGQLGFIDPISGPECYSADTEVFTDKGWVFWPDVTEDTNLAIDYIDNDIVYSKPDRIIDEEYSGLMIGVDNYSGNLLVTPNHRMYTVIDDGDKFVLASEQYGTDVIYRDLKGNLILVWHYSWYQDKYNGRVYCATVPTGKMLVRRGGGTGIWCGNSGKIGVDARFAYGTYKGKDGDIYGKFIDARTGKEKFMTPRDTATLTVGFPGYKDSDSRYVHAVRDGKNVRVKKEEVDIYVPSFARMFSQGVNLNPMPTGMQAGRQFYAAKFGTQFLPVHQAEAPLVDSLMPGSEDTTFRQYYGRKSATITSDVDGTVTNIKGNKIIITDSDGKKHTYDAVKNFPFNRMSGISYTPIVNIGDTVSKGDMVAKSNFTDDTGSLNLGANLKVAIIPGKGQSHDDAIVLSESAAKKLATDRMYGFDLSAKHGVEFGKDKHRSLFANTFTKDQYDTLDDNGVVLPGTILQKGDPIILGTGPKLMTAGDAMLGKLHRTLRNAFTDRSVTWEHDYPGEVVDAVNVRGRNANVNVISTVPVQVADKLSTNQAVKGVVGNIWGDEEDTDYEVTKIVPDDKMPTDAATGQPYEMLINPMTVLSRVSPNVIIEVALGKVAKKTGQRILLPQDPPEEGWANWAMNLLAEHGISDTADIFDPTTGRTVKGVGDGYTYMNVFHHLAEAKLSSRGGGGGYDIHEQPSRGGESGSKRVGNLTMGALLSHGVPEVIKDAMAIRGTQNEEYWKTLRAGNPLPSPKVPFIYTKFLETLKAGGINVLEKGSKTQILPMTDADVDRMAKYEINESYLLDDNFRPRPGGLFDPGTTGGTEGTNWTFIKLDEPLPNPVMEEPIRRVLGLKIKDVEEIISGTKELDGETGGRAIKKALSLIDPHKVLEDMKGQISTRRGSARDNAVKVASYMDACIKNDIKPEDWMVTKVPVLPPKFRPVARLGDMALSADLNELYRDLLEVRNNVRELRSVAGEDIPEEKFNLYNAVKAVYGLGEPITPEGQSKRLKGALRQIMGDSPKQGLYQRQVISKNVDNTGRAVISPDPAIDMDTVGIPEEGAWKSYRDFVIRRLSRRGYPQIKAIEMVEEKHPVAKAALVEEMKYRPVLLERAPPWHKFNIQAFQPFIAEGDTIRVSPLILKGYSGDADGDNVIDCIIIKVSTVKVDIIKRILGLTKCTSLDIVEGMINNTDLIIKDGEGFVTAIDIADMPRGELLFSKEGKNGPIDFHSMPDGIEVAAYDESTGTMVWAKPTVWSKHYGREIEIVDYIDGSQHFTDDDPRAVYGIANDAKDLTPSRFTPSDALEKQVCVPKTKLLPLINKTGIDSITPEEFKGTPWETIELTHDFGRFLGSMAGDGWWDKKSYSSGKRAHTRWGVYISDNEGYQYRAVEEVMGGLFKTEDNNFVTSKCVMTKDSDQSRYGDTVRYTFRFDNSNTLCNFLTDQLGGEGDETTSGCGNKHLPYFYLSGNEEFRKGIVCGLMDTDGAISINHSSDGSIPPRLGASFCTTSFRLAREARLLFMSLGVRASITWGKSSTSGTPCWYVNPSVMDLKETDVFRGMANERKLEVFDSQYVLQKDMLTAGDGVPMPKVLGKLLGTILVGLDTGVTTAEEGRLLQDAVSKGVRVNLVTRHIAGRVLEYTDKVVNHYRDVVNDAKELRIEVDTMTTIKEAILLVAPAHTKDEDPELFRISRNTIAELNRAIRTNTLPSDHHTPVIKDLLSRGPYGYGPNTKLLDQWRKIVDNKDVGWITVKGVQKTGIREDGYDLTVPGYDTFISLEGVTLSNTMTWHVPVSDEAAEEAKEKMLPSKNLLMTSDLRTPMHTPKQEMSLGLYSLTREMNNKKKPIRFSTKEEAKKAYRKGLIRANDPIVIG